MNSRFSLQISRSIGGGYLMDRPSPARFTPASFPLELRIPAQLTAAASAPEPAPEPVLPPGQNPPPEPVRSASATSRSASAGRCPGSGSPCAWKNR
jgi:hypothetical protein